MKTNKPSVLITTAAFLLLTASPFIQSAKAEPKREPGSGAKPEKQPKSDSQKHVDKATEHAGKAVEAGERGRPLEAIKEYKKAQDEIEKSMGGKNGR